MTKKATEEGFLTFCVFGANRNTFHWPVLENKGAKLVFFEEIHNNYC